MYTNLGQKQHPESSCPKNAGNFGLPLKSGKQSTARLRGSRDPNADIWERPSQAMVASHDFMLEIVVSRMKMCGCIFRTCAAPDAMPGLPRWRFVPYFGTFGETVKPEFALV
jgi:hypothetical protein